MAEYSKKTVAELQEILKSRSLPSSGKKAELIARLNENDKQSSTIEEAPVVPDAGVEPAAEPAEVEATSTDVPDTTVPAVEEPEMALAPSADPIATTADNPSPDTSLAAQATYSLNLPTSSLDNELAKRKARAERFGISAAQAGDDSAAPADGVAAADTDALKNLERAKRFGTGDTAIGKLDEALSSELLAGSRKRRHGAGADAIDMDDPGLKRSFVNRGRGRGGRFGGRGRNGRPGNTNAGRPQGVQKNGAVPAYTSEKDKLAAEARRKKFATA